MALASDKTGQVAVITIIPKIARQPAVQGEQWADELVTLSDSLLDSATVE
jgi:hypothetical protein